MALIPRLINIERCFTADPETLDTRNLSELPYPDTFILEDHDVSMNDFDATPDLAPEDVLSSRRHAEHTQPRCLSELHGCRGTAYVLAVQTQDASGYPAGEP